ncbi:MAG: hypothetical protein HY582_02220 [Candidatus Omnitrophica bacterium]|nr:hypothetical protein [Candidatus Omnitrophota bacterium]
MKKSLIFLLILVFTLSSMPLKAVYAAEYKETPIDSVGDWFATMGKSGAEKDQILAQRKAERMKKFLEREAAKAAKEAEKAGGDMKKKLGF